MFYTVFSTNDTPYMQWQSDLLEYSWKRVRQEGALVRLVATNTPHEIPRHTYAQCVATRLWDVHPDTGDYYPVYNKPASLLEWLFRDRPEGTVLLLDPDCVFRRPVTRRVAPGYPASQAWVDFSLGKPGARSPFGLGKRFSFLNDHCVRTDLDTSAVMIPTLIHTDDLRRIAARWLELCGVVRQNLRDGEGMPAWESDMFSYSAASAEYGLRHEPVSLGVCTNWSPSDAPDAPVVHYCQPVLDKDGREIFAKGRYSPWSRVDTSVEAAEDYGRALIGLINDYADDTEGVISPLPLACSPQRHEGVMEGRVLDDMLLEVPSEGRSVWLNASGKAIWELCDGSRTVAEIGAELAGRFAADESQVTPDVQKTAGNLRAGGFLQVHYH